MMNLQAIPDATGYAVVDGNEILTTDVPGGPSRTRRDFIGAPDTVTIQWTCGPNRYQYIRAFYRTATAKGSQPFQVQLAIDGSALEWYTCKFVSATFGTSSQQGMSYVIGATLEVAARLPTTDFDNSFIEIYSAYGDAAYGTFISLYNLVDVVLPKTLVLTLPLDYELIYRTYGSNSNAFINGIAAVMSSF